MKQITLAAGTFEPYRKTTRRERFLDEMDRVVPVGAAVRADRAGLSEAGQWTRMLRIYFLQQWFNLSDPGVEEALHDSVALLRFVGIDLGREPVPDETTILNFRHLLEAHELGTRLFEEVSAHLQEQGLAIARGTIVDATIISAPSSTKNAARERDPDMHQTKKGQQYYFGMKAHVGVDSQTKLIHSVVATARPMSPTAPCWPICCMARRHACGATRPTVVSARRFAPGPSTRSFLQHA